FVTFILIFACTDKHEKQIVRSPESENAKISLYVLGTVQDGGSPHIGCKKECCSLLFENPDNNRKVVSLGVVDHENKKSFLFEASPDMPSQLKILKELSGIPLETPDGIFLTHAHIGHYTGLMYLGREALSAKQVPVYAMPRMKSFLETNGPWDQLVALNNIALNPLNHEEIIELTPNLKVMPFLVPHRDEYSETVGYKITTQNASILFIPDINKWSKWKKNILNEIRQVDHAYLDATFFDGQEINTRDITEIPHPFVIESMALFEALPDIEKKKVRFIHFNHTNPLLNPDSNPHKNVTEKGFNIASFKERITL
ncbi:MAG: MBL fold metallo-hydrolase, partial [Flavobacteriaceae bacterium]